MTNKFALYEQKKYELQKMMRYGQITQKEYEQRLREVCMRLKV